ncbi:MAG TPA: hypothetical protein DCW31_01745 [Lactobacillus sp.]|nr:hypothetical protein [Lactobacillus sp.]
MKTTSKTKLLNTQVNELAQMIVGHRHVVALTGAGISVTSGIPDLEQMAATTSGPMSSEAWLEREPETFYRQFHQIFIDHIFGSGPTLAHYVLAQLEHAGHLDDVITTNVDYLHELAGTTHTANIWSSLNINHCLNCGRIYPIELLKQPVPHCPNCGGLISPDPIYRHIATVPAERERADTWTNQADLVIVIGSNGYYDHISDRSEIVDINPAHSPFEQRATLCIHETADTVFAALAAVMGLPTFPTQAQ